MESIPIHFTSNSDEVYNRKFTMEEITDSIHTAHDSATGQKPFHHLSLDAGFEMF